MHEFKELEDAVLLALVPLIDMGVKTLESYSGQLEVDDITRITVNFPCVYVIAGGLTNRKTGGSDEVKLDLILLVGDRNNRGGEYVVRGDTTSPGVYSILETIRGLLHRAKLFDKWPPAYLTAEEPLVYAPGSGLCFYIAKYEMWGQRKL